MEKQEVNFYEWSSPVGFFGGFIRIIGKDQFILKRGLTGKIKGVRLTVKDCSEYQKVQETVDLRAVSNDDLEKILNELKRNKKENKEKIKYVCDEIELRKKLIALETQEIKNAKIKLPEVDADGNIIKLDENNNIVIVDYDGNIVKKDVNGNKVEISVNNSDKVTKKDAAGNVEIIGEVDADNNIVKLDAAGNAVKDADGNDVIIGKVDASGNIIKVEVDGNTIDLTKLKIKFKEDEVSIHNVSQADLISYKSLLRSALRSTTDEDKKAEINGYIAKLEAERNYRDDVAEKLRSVTRRTIDYERTTETIIGKAVHKLAVRGLPIKIIWPWELIMFIEGGIIDLDTKPIQFQTTLKNGVGVENVVLDVDYKISIVDLKRFTSKLQDNSGDIQKIYRFIGDKFDEILQSYIETNGSSIDSTINGENATAIGFSENMINANRVAFERVCQDFGIELSEIKKKSFSHSPIKKDKAAMERQEIQNLLDQGFTQEQIVDMRRRNAVVNGNIGLGQQGAPQNPAPVNPNPAPVNPNPAPVNPNPAPVVSDEDIVLEIIGRLNINIDSITDEQIEIYAGIISSNAKAENPITKEKATDILKKLVNPLALFQGYLDGKINIDAIKGLPAEYRIPAIANELTSLGVSAMVARRTAELYCKANNITYGQTL